MKIPLPRFHRRDGLVLALCLSLLYGLARLIDHPRPPALDTAILSWLSEQLHGPVGEILLQVYRLSGVHFTAFLVFGALIYVLMQRWWRDLRLLVMASGGILILVDLILKPLFDRSRPPEKLLVVDGRSFPSGHAAGSVAFYGAMVVILASHHPHLRRPLLVGSCLWIGLVWLSTLYARAHWPTDLLAGGGVGLAWLTVCIATWRRPIAAGDDPSAAIAGRMPATPSRNP
ncbi:MAG: phosphatase PAP2 family protein [Cyanobium sp.]